MSAETTPTNRIRIAAAILMAPDNRILLVRKAGTTAFMQAGGKIENGETPVAALQRELSEELGLTVNQDQAHYLGAFSAPAANEPGYTVEAEVFRIALTQPVAKAAEIEEIVWVDPLQKVELPLAPLTENYLLPLCKEFMPVAKL
ncbi:MULTISPECIES: NUDIX hydrolase [Pseudochrobactrum]|uniref:8-oxo-dGTP diphosphatase n=1 Tax=Pseudochrobactrum saccharolyticum TaxID=354352 RepID=A0A7W8AJC7_9HYPH|nr:MULTISPECIES: NUDIX domain-containing protein [Pseudochrobactrum]MBX8782915.1 NUDIX domain-containing protein [Ochrobactrum sp. GRS2]KAB0539059.1 NUDIX domain-containing protein [Pseudochrobactrum saccharolyticum]MBB5090939.1 8-oxo-dGTP pyrophosphatase MutT (NUDIX family) [Pseudochrobactrum saccharolyticum]MDP8249648.1 NUDIX domain-containing protein [Pseudochrobactrum saccharolyticum]UCA46967.1 NUDIX domain-containing protein [Pseudochrobactrum sp. XF203]